MSFWRGVRRRLREAVPPVIFLLIATYFLWNATQGERGLRAYQQRQVELTQAQAELARTELELAAWERRVGSLRYSRVDLDALDERSRAMLNLSGDGKKLF
jgi:cell division protein FtsB